MSTYLFFPDNPALSSTYPSNEWRESLKESKKGRIVTDVEGTRHRYVSRLEKDLPWECIRIIKIALGILLAWPLAFIPCAFKSYREFFFKGVEVKKCVVMIPAETILSEEPFDYLNFCDLYGVEALKDCTPEQKKRAIKGFFETLTEGIDREEFAEEVAILGIDWVDVDKFQSALIDFQRLHAIKSMDAFLSYVAITEELSYLKKEESKLNNLNIAQAISSETADASKNSTQIDSIQEEQKSLQRELQRLRLQLSKSAAQLEVLMKSYKGLLDATCTK